MYLIDTNIFFELIFDRKHADGCEKLFMQIQDKKIKAICSHFSIHSICVYLLNGKKFGQAKQFLKQIYSLENMQYYIASQLGCEAIVTFDKGFKKTKMKIFEPKDIVVS